MAKEEGSRPELTARRAVELMERLARDDEFRARVEKEPRRALREYGIEFPRGRPRSVALPPKETLEAALRTIPKGQRLKGADALRLSWWWIERAQE